MEDDGGGGGSEEREQIRPCLSLARFSFSPNTRARVSLFFFRPPCSPILFSFKLFFFFPFFLREERFLFSPFPPVPEVADGDGSLCCSNWVGKRERSGKREAALVAGIKSAWNLLLLFFLFLSAGSFGGGYGKGKKLLIAESDGKEGGRKSFFPETNVEDRMLGT